MDTYSKTDKKDEYEEFYKHISHDFEAHSTGSTTELRAN